MAESFKGANHYVLSSSLSSSLYGLSSRHNFLFAAASTISSIVLKLVSANSEPSRNGCYFGESSIRNFLSARCWSSRRMWPKYTHRLSSTWLTVSKLGSRASSWIVRFVIWESIFELTPLIFFFICVVNIQASDACVMGVTTSDLYKPRQVRIDSLVDVRHFL